MSPESYLQSLTHKQYTIERLSALETSTRNSKKNFDFFKENGLGGGNYELADEEHRFNAVLKRKQVF